MATLKDIETQISMAGLGADKPPPTKTVSFDKRRVMYVIANDQSMAVTYHDYKTRGIPDDKAFHDVFNFIKIDQDLIDLYLEA